MLGIIKRRKSLNDIGKEQFNFAYTDEKYIYARLCRVRASKRKISKETLEKEIGSYKEWEKYIHDKYVQYDKAQLIEFSRYLNLRLRNTKPDQEIWNIVLAAAVTLFIDKTYELWDEISRIDLPEEVPLKRVVELVWLSILSIIAIMVFWMEVLMPIFNAKLEKNLFFDYKEIIDARIEELEKLEK